MCVIVIFRWPCRQKVLGINMFKHIQNMCNIVIFRWPYRQTIFGINMFKHIQIMCVVVVSAAIYAYLCKYHTYLIVIIEFLTECLLVNF